MQKVFIQGVTIIILFFSTWFLFSQIDWMTVFKVDQNTKKTEEKLGEIFWDIFNKTEQEIDNPYVINTIDSLVNKICVSNNIDRTDIKIHILSNDDINAFTLPNGHIVIYSGLILASDNQNQLNGVICHEIAHMELNHVMKKLIKEVGLSVLISMTTGSGGSEIIKESIKMLSSTALDRNLEKEADIKAVDYLVNANIESESFANFLYNLSDSENTLAKYLSWTSTHPDSKERAEYIIEYSSTKPVLNEPVLNQKTWEILIEKLQK